MMFLFTQSALGLPLTGRVRANGRAGDAKISTIVYAEAIDGKTTAQPGQFSIAQKNKAFLPHVLAVPVGSTVSFPNEDLIFHNVFTLSRPNPFDLGLYRSGAAHLVDRRQALAVCPGSSAVVLAHHQRPRLGAARGRR